MKKPRKADGVAPLPDDLKAEYAFDFRKARPNRFAGNIDHDCLVVSLDADVAEVFKTSETVNAVLRAMIFAMREASTPSLVTDQK